MGDKTTYDACAIRDPYHMKEIYEIHKCRVSFLDNENVLIEKVNECKAIYIRDEDLIEGNYNEDAFMMEAFHVQETISNMAGIYEGVQVDLGNAIQTTLTDIDTYLRNKNANVNFDQVKKTGFFTRQLIMTTLASNSNDQFDTIMKFLLSCLNINSEIVLLYTSNNCLSIMDLLASNSAYADIFIKRYSKKSLWNYVMKDNPYHETSYKINDEPYRSRKSIFGGYTFLGYFSDTNTEDINDFLQNIEYTPDEYVIWRLLYFGGMAYHNKYQVSNILQPTHFDNMKINSVVWQELITNHLRKSDKTGKYLCNIHAKEKDGTYRCVELFDNIFNLISPTGPFPMCKSFLHNLFGMRTLIGHYNEDYRDIDKYTSLLRKVDENLLIRTAFDPELTIAMEEEEQDNIKEKYFPKGTVIRDTIIQLLFQKQIEDTDRVTLFDDENTISNYVNEEGKTVEVDILGSWTTITLLHLYLSYMNTQQEFSEHFKERIKKYSAQIIYPVKKWANMSHNGLEHPNQPNHPDEVGVETYIDYCCLICDISIKCGVLSITELITHDSTFMIKLLESAPITQSNKTYNIVGLCKKIIDAFESEKREISPKLIMVFHLMAKMSGEKLPKKYRDKSMKNFATYGISSLLSSEKSREYLGKYFDIETLISDHSGVSTYITKIIPHLSDENKQKVKDNPEIVFLDEGTVDESKFRALIEWEIIDKKDVEIFINDKYNFTVDNVTQYLLNYANNVGCFRLNIEKCFIRFLSLSSRYGAQETLRADMICFMYFIENSSIKEIHYAFAKHFDKCYIPEETDKYYTMGVTEVYFFTLLEMLKKQYNKKVAMLYMNCVSYAIERNEYIRSVHDAFVNNSCNHDILENLLVIFDEDYRIVKEFISSMIGNVNMAYLYNNIIFLNTIETIVGKSNDKEKFFSNALTYAPIVPKIGLSGIFTKKYWNSKIADVDSNSTTNIKKYIKDLEKSSKNRTNKKLEFLRYNFEKHSPPCDFDELCGSFAESATFKKITNNTFRIIKSFSGNKSYAQNPMSQYKFIEKFIEQNPGWILDIANVDKLFRMITDEDVINRIVRENMEKIKNCAHKNFELVIHISSMVQTVIKLELDENNFEDFSEEHEADLIDSIKDGMLQCNLDPILKFKPHLAGVLPLTENSCEFIIKNIKDVNKLNELVILHSDEPLVKKLRLRIVKHYCEVDPFSLVSILSKDNEFHKNIDGETLNKIKKFMAYDYRLIKFMSRCGYKDKEISKIKSLDGNPVVCTAICTNPKKYGKYVREISEDNLFEKNKMGYTVIEHLWNSDGARKLIMKRKDWKKIQKRIAEEHIILDEFSSKSSYFAKKIRGHINVFMSKCIGTPDSSWLNDIDSDDMEDLLKVRDTKGNPGLFYVIKYYPSWVEENILDISETLSNIREEDKCICNRMGETLAMYCLRHSPKCYEVFQEHEEFEEEDCYISNTRGSVLTYSAQYCIKGFTSIMDESFFVPYTLNTYDMIYIIDFYVKEKLKFKTISNLANILIVNRRESEFNVLMQRYGEIVDRQCNEEFIVNCDKYNSLKLALLYCPKIALTILNSRIGTNEYVEKTLSYFTNYEQFRNIGLVQPESWVYIMESKNPIIKRYKKDEVCDNNIYGVRMNQNYTIENHKDHPLLKTIKNTQIYECNDDNCCKTCMGCKETIVYSCGHRMCVRCHVMRMWGDEYTCQFCNHQIEKPEQVVYIG